MSQPNKGGRPSVFGSKKEGVRLQGVITATGSVRFNAARRRLAKLAQWEEENISDADVIEYMARGDAETAKFLAKK